MDRPNPGLYRDENPDPALDPAAQPVRDETAPAAEYAPDAAGYPQGAGQPAEGLAMTTPPTLRRFDPWNYREETALGDGADVVGYTVEALDGHIGKIDQSSTLVGDSYLVVDTGPWIFGKRVLLPAGTVNHVDSLDQKVYVDRTKAQIKDSPEFDPDQFGQEYRDKLGGYYDSTYADSPYTDPSYTDPAGSNTPTRDHSTYGDSRPAE